MLRNPIHKRLDRLAQDRWTRRAIRILLRSAWVGLSLIVIGLGLRMLTNWQIGIMNLIAVAMLCMRAERCCSCAARFRPKRLHVALIGGLAWITSSPLP